MLPLSDLVLVGATVDEDGRSPVADDVAGAWGVSAGLARFVRSSATHVFSVAAGDHRDGPLFLRCVPASRVDPVTFERPAQLLSRMTGAGGAVVAPVPSVAGRLLETVTTSVGVVHAVAVTAAAGESVDVDDLMLEQATGWGAALARFHLDAAPASDLFEPPIRSVFAVLADDSDDADVVAAARELDRRWDRTAPDLPTGVLHGDFELDNLCWAGRRVTAFDADSARIGAYVEDIAFAVRDLVGDHPDRPVRPDLLRAFLDGYDGLRPVVAAERRAFGLATAGNAARSLLAGHGVVDPVPQPEPPWLPALTQRLHAYFAEQRRQVLAAAARSGAGTAVPPVARSGIGQRRP